MRQLKSRHHHNSELVYTFDKRGLYIKKQKHHKPREETLIDLQDDSFTTEQLVSDAVNMNFNMDSYIKADASSTGFVDFGDNIVDDLRVDNKMIEDSY